MLLNRDYHLHPRTNTWVAPALHGPYKPEPMFERDDKIVMWACGLTSAAMLLLNVWGWL